MHQIRFRLRLRPRPRWGTALTYSTLPDPLARFNGPTTKDKGRGGEWKGGKERERDRMKEAKGGEKGQAECIQVLRGIEGP